MKKMTIRKLLENIVAKSYGQEIKKFYLVSTDGEVVTADFAIDLVQNVAGWNFLWGKSKSFPRSASTTTSP